jgi:hypothetical protein
VFGGANVINSNPKTYVTILSAWVITFLCLSSTWAQSDSSSVEVTRGDFSFKVPNSWQELKAHELTIFKEQYEATSHQLFEENHGQAEDYETAVPFICGFSSPSMDATVVILTMSIPLQMPDYIEEVYSNSKEIIDWGIKQGQVKQCLSNQLSTVAGIRAHESDLIMGDGSRMKSYGLIDDSKPNQVIQISGMFGTNADSSDISKFDNLVAGLQIGNKVESNDSPPKVQNLSTMDPDISSGSTERTRVNFRRCGN